MRETYLVLCNALDAKLDTVLRENNYHSKMDATELKEIEVKYIALCSNIIFQKLESTDYSRKEKQLIETLIQPELIKNLNKQKWMRYFELNNLK